MPHIVDPGQFQTDQILAGIESRVHDAYDMAWAEMEEQARKKMASFEAAKKKALQQLANEEITETEYKNWLYRQAATNKKLQELVDVLAEDMHHANVIAMQIANGGMADVYALNANYATFEIYQQLLETGQLPKAGLSFSLYNHDTAEALLKTEWTISPEPGKNALLPKPSAKKLKELKKLSPDELWNQKKLQSAILQGVLQGEGPAELATRLRSVAKMNEHQAIRNARTMTTNVQNMGRQQAYSDAKSMGTELRIEWYAILDGVTRHSHRLMHGKTKENSETAKFPNGLRWPGDPTGDPGEVYNCRCTTVSWLKGHEQDAPRTSAWLKKQQLAFEDWQNEQR